MPVGASAANTRNAPRRAKNWAGNAPLFVAPLSHGSGTMRSFRSAEPAAMTEAELGNSCPGAEKPSSTSIGRDVRK
jgi:hypothetical protein